MKVQLSADEAGGQQDRESILWSGSGTCSRADLLQPSPPDQSSLDTAINLTPNEFHTHNERINGCRLRWQRRATLEVGPSDPVLS